MLYLKCPTCRTNLANKQLIYEREIEKVCNDPNLKGSDLDKAKAKILDDVKLWRICCRMRIMTYNKLIDLIL